MEMKENQSEFVSSGCKTGKEMDEVEDIFQALEKTVIWNGNLLGRYNGFWFRPELLRALLKFQTHFEAKDTDTTIASTQKSGTTWLKALVYSIINRHRYAPAESPLLSSNPHALVPFYELMFLKSESPDINGTPNPRIFSTHIPYQLLPNTILDSRCKIVYICRNPLDIFVSNWHFNVKNQFAGPLERELLIDEAFESFCNGKLAAFGPFWDHMLGYWHASLKNPKKILFLKYEDLKKDIITWVKKLAYFLDFPFSAEEEMGGVIEEITKLCSFEKLRNLEVNKNGEWQPADWIQVKCSSFFRKGEVGDWANYLSPAMVERLLKLMKEKFGESGLFFEIQLLSGA